MTEINPMFTREMVNNMRRLDITQRDINNHYMKEPDVPCNGCTACCRNFEMIRLDERDDIDPEDMVGAIMQDGSRWVVLKHQENGDCIYLQDGKCSVYEKRPLVCRQYDCRFEHIVGLFAPETLDSKKDHENFDLRSIEGKNRLHTLPAKSRRIATFISKYKHYIATMMNKEAA